MTAVWEALAASPALDLFATLAAFQLGLMAYERCGRHPMLMPVFVGLLLVVAWNLLIGREFSDYAQGSTALAVMLGPVTVALAVPLYERLRSIRALAGPLTITWLLTAALVTGAALGLAQMGGADPVMQMSLLPKAATTPIAILISDAIGGIAAIAAVVVLLTGIFGAMVGPALLRRLGIDSEIAIGFALGLSAHAVGTARAFEISPRCGAFAALGMSLMGGLLALVLPLIFG